jgi:hypothetical protein
MRDRLKKSLLLLLLLPVGLKAQEFNSKVSVIAPQVANAEPRIFKSLENSVMQLMNTRRWTNYNYAPAERIDCNFLFTINEMTSMTSFKGTMQVVYSRPVYGTDYLSPVLEILDNSVQFTYVEGAQIEFSPDRYINNLSSLMGFYAYFMLGVDADTYKSMGGTEFYELAQQVVSNAQNTEEPGWKPYETQKNRYWLVDNQQQAVFRPLRELLYNYHRNGFDQMSSDPANARKVIVAAIEKLKTVHQAKPSSYNLQVMFNAKYNELINLFKPADPAERSKVLNTLQVIDPGHIQQYQRMVSGS